MAKTKKGKPRLQGAGGKFVRVPQWWLHAISLYGRLTGVERMVLDVVVHNIWGFTGFGRTSASVSLTTLQTRCPTKTKEGLRRALVALRTPGDQTYSWSKGSRSKQGHGIVVLDRPGSRHLDAVYSLQEDWTAWGWEPGTDLEMIAAILAEYHIPDELQETWTKEAEVMALALRQRCQDRLGDHADVPLAQHQDRVWRRWCATMQGLVDRGFTQQHLRGVLRYVESDEWWDSALRGHGADMLLVKKWDSLLIRTANMNRSRMRL